MKKEFFFVCAAVFLLVFGGNVSGTMLVPYAKSMGGTSLTIGIVYGSMYAVRLLFAAPIGRLSERKGTKTILKWSLMLYPVIAAVYWLSRDIPSLIAARLLHGVASAMMLPMAMAYIGGASPAGREGRYMGVYNMILFAASAAGPFAGGLIYDNFGVKNAFFTLFIFAVLSLAVMLAFVRSGKGTAQTEKKYAKETGGLRLLIKNGRLMALGGVYVVTAVLIALFGASLTQLALSYEFSMGLIGLLIAIFNAVVGIAQIPLGRFADRFDKVKLVAASGAASAAAIMLLPMIKSLPGLVILVIAAGIFTALNLTSATGLSAVLGKEAGMGRTMGFLASATSVGTIAGYLGLGWVTDASGIAGAFYLAGAVFLAGTAAFLPVWALSVRKVRPDNSFTG
jgi:DHA1 family multidrug resistance protein-like MFS transporter